MTRVHHGFAIHDLLTMRIRDTIGLSDRAFMRPLRGYIHYAITPPADFEPDIDIDIAPFEYQNDDYSLVDRRFRVAPDYFACEDTFKILWWKLEMSGFERGRVNMRIDRNSFGTAAIGSRLIDCLVRFELARRGGWCRKMPSFPLYAQAQSIDGETLRFDLVLGHQPLRSRAGFL